MMHLLHRAGPNWQTWS